MANFLSDQTPEAKRTRTIIAIGVGGLVALIFLARRNAGAATDPSIQPSGVQGAAVPSTFADNGEAMSNFGTTTSDALGQVATTLQDLQGTNDQLSQVLTDLQKPVTTPVSPAGGTSGNPARTTYGGQVGSWGFENGRYVWHPAVGLPKISTETMRQAASRLHLKGIGAGNWKSPTGDVFKWSGTRGMVLTHTAARPKPKPKRKTHHH